jgi:hypothetical protein
MTTDPLSSDVAISLHRRPALIDATATQRVMAHVAHAPRRPRRRLVVVGSVAGATGTGAIAVAVVLSGATPAFAGWTANPSRNAATASATNACAKQLASMPDGPGEVTWLPAATDVRGPYVLEVLASGALSATCLTGPSLTSVSFGSGDGSPNSTGTPNGVDPAAHPPRRTTVPATH